MGNDAVRLFSRLRVESDAMLHFDALRFIASAGIVWHHSHEYLYPVVERGALFDHTRPLALFVDLFFVISGFVIAYVYSGRIRGGSSYLRFLQRRIGRLIPLHWLTLALSLAFWMTALRLTPSINHPPETGAACVAQTALLLNGLFACGNGNVLNGVTWSISVEMAMYVLFPLLLPMLRHRMLSVVATLAAFVLACSLLSTQSRWDNLYPVVRALPSFLFGMTLFAWRGPLKALPVTSAWVAGFVVLLFVAMMNGVHQLAVIVLVWLIALLAVAADARMTAGRLVRAVAPFGQLTYGIYMWHSILVLSLVNILGDKLLRLGPVGMAVLLVLVYALILVVAWVSLFMIETPLRRWVDRVGPSRGLRGDDRAEPSAAP